MHFNPLRARRTFPILLLLMTAAFRGYAQTDPPNIVYILCDNLGYGDVHTLNPDRCKISTPDLDHLRAEGMAFTDCHASSSICSPSRYSILTGR